MNKFKDRVSTNLNKKDVIFISIRGNRRVLCNSEETMKLVKDSEVVEKVVKELGW